MKPTEAIDTGYVHPNVARVDAIWDEAISTPQPAPIRNNNPSVHDLVILDLITPTEEYALLGTEIWERKTIGLAEYGTPLQAHNGRDCETDAIEEMVDSICYLKQGLIEGKFYLEPIYHRMIALTIDTINLRAINAETQEHKAALTTAPYYDVVVEVDGVVNCYKTRALSGEEAARLVLDNSICSPNQPQPQSVKLISFDLTESTDEH